MAFDPYGKPKTGGANTASGAPGTSLGFQGGLTDKITGNILLGARQYDPKIARFTTPDVFIASGLDLELGTDALIGNRYLFAGANPVAFYEDGHRFGIPKFIKKVAKKAIPYVPVVGAAVEAVSVATGRDLLDGGRKMSGRERLIRTGALAAGAALGVVAGAVAGKVIAKSASKAKAGAKVLADAEGATAAQIANSIGGPTAGSRVGQAKVRKQLLEEADGKYTCWRCGQQSTNPQNMHLGHRNVPASKGGNLSRPTSASKEPRIT